MFLMISLFILYLIIDLLLLVGLFLIDDSLFLVVLLIIDLLLLVGLFLINDSLLLVGLLINDFNLNYDITISSQSI